MSSYFGTQWAAVRMCRLLIITPPQIWYHPAHLSQYNRATIQGNFPTTLGFWPPAILSWIFVPHPVLFIVFFKTICFSLKLNLKKNAAVYLAKLLPAYWGFCVVETTCFLVVNFLVVVIGFLGSLVVVLLPWPLIGRPLVRPCIGPVK